MQFAEQKMEQGILTEQCQRLQRTNAELHKTAESLSRRMAVSTTHTSGHM